MIIDFPNYDQTHNSFTHNCEEKQIENARNLPACVKKDNNIYKFLLMKNNKSRDHDLSSNESNNKLQKENEKNPIIDSKYGLMNDRPMPRFFQRHAPNNFNFFKNTGANDDYFFSNSMNDQTLNSEEEMSLGSNSNMETSKDYHWTNILNKFRHSTPVSDVSVRACCILEDDFNMKHRRRPSWFMESCKEMISSASTFMKLNADDDEQNIEKIWKHENSDFYQILENDDRFWIEDDGWITLPSERIKK